MIPASVLAEYQASRPSTVDRSVLCHAPFVSLNFDQSGRVTACCYNRQHLLGTYPENSLREIWTGASAKALRAAFLAGSEASGCESCFDRLRSRDFSGALMRNFDRYGIGGKESATVDRELPLVLEFEIANTCHLECVMCGGHWSSAIRSRRERLPPLPNPYDGRFLEQIEELLPTIVAAKFLGGEPFLIQSYLGIWEGIRRLNPRAKVSITTSGAVLPARARAALEQIRADIVVSLDGITKTTYESIRRNASFEQVMDNIRYFRDYTRQRGTTLSAAVCPMTHNWRELRAIVEFCEENRMTVFFNTVTFPVESSLASLGETALAEVLADLESGGAGGAGGPRAWTARNRTHWQGLVQQLRGWMERQRAATQLEAELAAAANARATKERAAYRRNLDRAWESLAGDLGGRLDPSRREKIERYLESLSAHRSQSGLRSTATDGETGPAPRIRDLTELEAMLDAALLFHLSIEPAAGHGAFFRRLDLVRAALTPEARDRVLRALEDVEIPVVYDFLSSAPDAEFEHAMSAFAK